MFLVRNWLVTTVLAALVASFGWFYAHSPGHLCDGSRTHMIGIAGYQECSNYDGAVQ
ncbi:MAG: hypothetical protein AAGC79_04555 [Pseudomonadota bacterium]